MSTPEPSAVYVDGYRGAEVADSIVAHSPRGTVHALRPAAANEAAERREAQR